MYGDRKPYPVALITLDPEEIGPWAKEQGLPEDLGELAENEAVREIVQKELDRANSNYAQVEQVKRFKILDHDLSIDTGELTPTLKVKRNVIYERYEDLFEAMYAIGRGARAQPESAAPANRVGGGEPFQSLLKYANTSVRRAATGRSAVPSFRARVAE